MKNRRCVKVVAISLLFAVFAGSSMGQDLVVQSFNGAGQLVFNTLISATNYRLECATSPAGPWSDTWVGFVALPPEQAGSVTCSVPVFYRVVATVTNAWLVIDTAGSIAFGAVRVGDTVTRTLTLKNRGGAPLTVTGIDYPEGFSGDWSGVIQPGWEQQVVVTFTPLENMDYGGMVTVHSDATGGSGTLTVSGRGASDYLVIDVSEGASASSYPVSYLAAVPVGGWSDVYKTTKIVMRRIPAFSNSFTMGSPSDELGRDADEMQHEVTLTQGFFVGVFEVTQKQWALVMDDWPSYFTNSACRDARPVERVNHNAIRGSSAGANWPADNNVDAQSFLGLLRAKTGFEFDLPTEAQWEYACRAGVVTALNSGYDITNENADAHMAQVGRYDYNRNGGYTQNGDTSVGSAKVGSYLPNVWGLYDMHGNVWECCLDWYGSYADTATDPKGAVSGSGRIIRGGCWDFPASLCRSADRRSNAPSYTGNIIDGSYYNCSGFRIVLPAGP